MKQTVIPFSTLGPGEAALRVGIGSLACASILQDKTPQQRKTFSLLVDASTELSATVKGVEDINFWPVAVGRVYQKVGVLDPGEKYHLTPEWLYHDTVVFNLGDNLPQENSALVIREGLHRLDTVMLAFVYDNKTHWFVCGGDVDFQDSHSFFLSYGNVGTASAKGLVEQFDLIMQNLSFDEQEKEQFEMTRWMIANALIANLGFTALSVQM